MSALRASVDDTLTPEEGEAYQRVLQVLLDQLSLDLRRQPRSRILRRLYRRLRGQALESLAEYADLLAHSASEVRELASELQMPVARLFRDPRLYAGLSTALPHWLDDHPAPSIWVPACGGGDELIALALIIARSVPDRCEVVQLIGTDADAAAIERARSGLIAPEEARLIPRDFRAWLQLQPDGSARLHPEILRRLHFSAQPLLAPPPVAGISLIACRGIVGGLALGAQRRLMEMLHRAIDPMGRLLVAADEEGLIHRDLFAPVDEPGVEDAPDTYRRVERRRGRTIIAAAPLTHEKPAETPEAVIRGFFELSTEPMVLIDAVGVVQAANPAMASWMRRTPGDLVGADLLEWLDSDPLSITAPGTWVPLQVGVRAHRSARIRAPSGTSAVVLQVQRLGPDTLAVVVQFEDEVRHLRDTLEVHRRRGNLVSDMLREAAVMVDANGTITYFTAAAERLSGWRREEAIGAPVERILPLCEPSGTTIDWRQDLRPDSDEVRRWDSGVLLKREGRRLNVRIDARAVPQADGGGGLLILSDITVYTLLTEELAYRSAHDPLTGLLGREELERRLSAALLESRRIKTTHVFAYLDLDQFKVINDTLGHFAGDELLRQFAGLVRGWLRQQDVAGRLGGDEFGVLLENQTLEGSARMLEALLIQVRAFRFQWDSHAYGITVSVGLVLIDPATPSTARVLSEADSACFAAKDAGRDRIHTAGTSDEVSRRQGEMGMVARINRALDLNLFELYYEDVVRCRAPKQVVYRELLVRMRDEERPGQLVSPGLFIPAAERYFLMGALDRWVVNAALAGIAQRPADGVLYAVNLSGISINDTKFLNYVLSRFDHHGVAAEQVCFEITETAAITHLKEARRFIERLVDVGCCFALDDFGAGMSSFSYLRNLPVTYLKIDGSFVRSMLQNRVDRGMVEAINRIGHEMGLKTIAEHVEDAALLSTLADIGVDYAQGWAVARGRPFQSLLKTDD